MTDAKARKAGRVLWVGLSNGEIHFYKHDGYYQGVLCADLFKSKRAAKKCYVYVQKVIVCLPPRKGPSRERQT